MRFYQIGPIFSGTIQLILIIWFLAKGKIKDWPERFFILYLIFASGYCFIEFFGNIPRDYQTALFMTKILYLFINFIPLWGILFAISLERELRKSDLLLFVPTIVFIPFIWIYLIKYIFYAFWGWYSTLNQLVWRSWVLYFLCYVFFGLWSLNKVQKILTEESDVLLRKKILIIFYSFVLLVFLAIFTNVIILFFNISVFRPLTSFLFIPSVLMFYALVIKK